MKDVAIRGLLLLHILGAIAAVGPTLTYGMWAARAERHGPQHRSFVLDTVSWVDGHLATPAFVAQAITGVGLILVVGWDFFRTAWLLTGVGMYVVTVAVAIAVYAPTVRRHRAASAALDQAPDDPEVRVAYHRAASTSRRQGVVVTATLAIVFLMVVKPSLWD